MPIAVGRAVFSSQARRPPALQGAELQAQLRPLAADLTLGMLGEDDGGSLTASFRRGPVKQLTATNVLKALGFKDPAKEQRYDAFSFQRVAPSNAEFWDRFTDLALDPSAAARAKQLLTGPNVKAVATMVCDDHKNNFGASAYLVAQMKDGSLAVLKGTIGGMSF